MIPICGVPSVVLFGVYGITGIIWSFRVLKHGKNGPPLGWAMYRKESYTPEGRRLLRLFLRWWGSVSISLAALFLVLAGGILCSLTEPSGAGP